MEIVFTTLPAGRTDIEGIPHLRLSVFASVKLNPANGATLGKFPDLLDWPQKMVAGEFVFRWSNGTETEAQLVKNSLDPDLYRQLFRPEIRVKGPEKDTPDIKRIVSFPAVHVKEFMLKNYGRVAVESPTRGVSPEKFLDTARFAPLSGITLDTASIMQAGENARQVKNLTAPQMMVRQEEPSRQIKTRLNQEKFIRFSPQMDPRLDFGQFRTFHKLEPGGRKTARPPLQKPEFDFHDILSVLTNYPQLMRKCGFILDFLLPAAGAPASGSLRMIPASIDLEDDDAQISVPATAFQLTASGFFTADKPGSLFRNGFVKINTPAFEILQVDADGTAIKAHNMAETKVQEVARFYEDKIRFTQMTAVTPMQVRAAGVTSRAATVQPSAPAVAEEPVEPEPPAEEGLPAMRSAGIAIVRNGMAEQLHAKITANLKLIPDLKKMAIALPTRQTDPSLRVEPLKMRSFFTRELDLKKIQVPEILLYSDDLVQGYRMDVAYDDKPGKWYSLHRKKDHYRWYDPQGNPHEVEEILPDEGFIELAAAEDPDNPGDLFVPETLARWEGWSLALHMPGYSINNTDDDPAPSDEKRDRVYNSRILEAKKYAFDPDLDFKMNVQSEIIPGTLPRLRFGRNYRLRIRTVDLAGNSPSPDAPSESPAETERVNIRYLRHEPLASPILLVGNPLRDGEFAENMVIRSNLGQSSTDYESQYGGTSDCERYLLPPKNSVAMAETHGMLDKAFGNNPAAAKALYDLITSHEGSYENGDPKKERVFRESEVEVIYLPDPMAAGVAFFLTEDDDTTHTQEFTPRMFGFYSNAELSPDQTNGKIPEEWIQARPLRIRLEEGETGASWQEGSRILRVSLPKGHRTRIRFSTFWREEDFKRLSAIWKMIADEKPANLATLEKLARAGQHWMLSPFRELELVHAVQQPLEIPVFKALVPERDFDQTYADLHLRFTVEGHSTGKATLAARWSEPWDDGISVDIKERSGSFLFPDTEVHYHDQTITLGSVADFTKVAPHLQLREPLLKKEAAAQREPAAKRGSEPLQMLPVVTLPKRSVADFAREPQPGTLKINQLHARQTEGLARLTSEWNGSAKLLPDRVRFDLSAARLGWAGKINLRLRPLRHPFGDTRHRWVDYRLTATSRYGEYFEKIFRDHPELSALKEGEWQEKVNILSSARPHLPEIDYVIPTFEWRKTQTTDAVRHRRMGGGLRIYLKRPWYSSGPDEMVAILLPPQGQQNSQMTRITTMVPTPAYTDLYTHWAMDPLLMAVPPDSPSPKAGDFRMNPLQDPNLEYPGEEKARTSIVAYPVRFDREKQQWYCDLAIDPGQVYFPFVRLALARYQPYSVKKEDHDVCLSPVAFSTFIQLVPERQTTLRFTKDDQNSRFTLTVEGTIYNERLSASFGNRSLLRISFLDSHMAQPIYGFIDDGSNEKKLEDEGYETPITQRDVANNRYTITQEFRLPREYKTAPFQVIIEEFERGPERIPGIDQLYAERLGQSEETDRLIYADVFKINEVKK